MLSVNGINGVEVFANLSVDQRLDDREKAAAKRIHDSLKIRLDFDLKYRETHPNDMPQEPPVRHVNYSLAGGETVTFIDGTVTFRVMPYTTGRTVNVGIDKH